MEGWIEILRVALWPVLTFLLIIILAIIFRKSIGHLIQSFQSVKIKKEKGKIEIEIENRVKNLETRLTAKMPGNYPKPELPNGSTVGTVLQEAKGKIRKNILPHSGSMDPEESGIVKELKDLDGQVQSVPEENLPPGILKHYYTLVNTAAEYFSEKVKKDT